MATSKKTVSKYTLRQFFYNTPAGSPLPALADIHPCVGRKSKKSHILMSTFNETGIII